MSDRSRKSKVATKFEELAEALEVDIEDVQVTIEDGGLGATVISGADVAEALTEGEDDTIEDGEDEEEAVIEDDEDTTEGGDGVDVHFEEMDYKELQKLASEQLESYPDDQSKTGLVEALQNDIEDVEDLTEGEEDTTEGGENDISISDTELLEAGVSEGNLEAVRKYRSKNGVCQKEDCPYGANDDSEFCASHQGSKSKSKTSNDSPKESRELSDLSEGEQNLVSTLISDEGKSLEEAISMV